MAAGFGLESEDAEELEIAEGCWEMLLATVCETRREGAWVLAAGGFRHAQSPCWSWWHRLLGTELRLMTGPQEGGSWR